MAVKISKPVKGDQKDKPKQIMQGKYDFPRIKEDFILQNMRAQGGRFFTLEQCAKKWNVPDSYLRKVASEQDWIAEFKKRQEEMLARVTVEVQHNIELDEVEVRTRQVAYARLVQNKAIERLRKINPDYLTEYAAARLLELGLMQERDALGLPKHFALVPGNTDDDGKHVSVVEHIQRQQKLRQMGARFLDYIEGQSRRVPETRRLPK